MTLEGVGVGEGVGTSVGVRVGWWVVGSLVRGIFGGNVKPGGKVKPGGSVLGGVIGGTGVHI